MTLPPLCPLPNPVLTTTICLKLPDPSHLKGVESESLAFIAFQKMIKFGKGIRELKTPPIVGVIHAVKNSWLDRHGIDFVAILEDGHRIPVSVKSSERSQRKFKRQHRMRSAKAWFVALTEAIVVRAKERMKSVIRRLAEFVNRMYVIMLRETNKARFLRRSQSIRRHGRVPERGTFVRQICFAR